MRVGAFTLLLAIGCAALACVTPPSPERDDAAGVAIYLDARAMVKIVPARVDQVLFAQLEESDGESVRGYSVYPSNYEDDGYFYLLNPPPGRYVAVAAVTAVDQSVPMNTPGSGWQKGLDGEPYYVPPLQRTITSEYAIFFEEAMVRETEVATRSGVIRFLGEFRVETSMLREPDPIQAHYYQLLKPGQSGNVVAQALLHDAYSYDGEAVATERSDEARERFLSKARKHLDEVGWGAIVERSREDTQP